MPGNSVGNGTLDTDKKWNLEGFLRPLVMTLYIGSQICQNQLNSKNQDGSLGPALFLMYTDHKLKIGMMPWYAGAYAMLVVSYLNAHSVWISAKRSNLWILNFTAKNYSHPTWGSNQGPLGNWNAALTRSANPTARQTHPNLNFRAKLNISKVFKSLANVVKMRPFRIDFQLLWLDAVDIRQD